MDPDSATPRSILVALEGPPRGRTIEVDAAEVTIGRDSTNSLQLDDRAASRRHCVLKSRKGGVQIQDLDSRNGTYVNGLPVGERQLQHNDQIRIGSSVFLFQQVLPDEPGAVKLDESGASEPSTQWKSGGSLYFDEAQLNASVPHSNRTVHGLRVLLRISQAVQSAQSPQSLAQRVLDTLLESIPVDAGAILLGDVAELNSTFSAHRRTGDRFSVQIPSEIAGQVLSGRGGTLFNHQATGNSGPRSSIAVPLPCRDRIEGLLYLEAEEGNLLDNYHLELASAVGILAGLAIHNLWRWETLRSENERLQAAAEAANDMIGSSPSMARVFRFIAQAAPRDTTVLIGGESGTGKELVARALHRNSPRREKPFVAINCAALTESLLEDELFGHERGAFTGAVTLKKGRFEVANSGTLFLDEVGELAPGLQAKLLRVLQHREFERVGGTRPIQVDVRIIAATNRDLQLAAKENTFRQDLFFRLNVISVTLPPLRERREDIPLLASHFARKIGEKINRRVDGLSPAAAAALEKYDWPGNVRELENAIERALVLGTSDVVLPEDLPQPVLDAATPRPQFIPGDRSVGDFQSRVFECRRRIVREALDQAGGVFTDAAKILKVHPNYLHRLVNNLGLR